MADGYCARCQKDQPVVNVAEVIAIPGVRELLGMTLMPSRCAVCLGARRLFYRQQPPFPQTREEVDRRLSVFDKTLKDFYAEGQNNGSLHEIERFIDEPRQHIARLKQNGFHVGGRFERVLHVARVDAEFFLNGYIGRFFYLLFIPLTYWHLRARRAANPAAHFFPVDRFRAERIVLTDKRLVLYVEMDEFYYHLCSVPLSDIREARQHRSSIRLQLRHQVGRATITARVGREIGSLMRALHELSPVVVRDPSREWAAKGLTRA